MYYSIGEIINKIQNKNKLLYNAICVLREFETGIRFFLCYCINRNQYQSILKSVMEGILKKYDTEYIEDRAAFSAKIEKNQYKIWVMWRQGKESMPELIKACFRKLRKCADGYEVVFLHEKNIEEYVPVPEIIREKYKKGMIPEAQYSDYIRVSLLQKYGGLWVDASVYCMNKIEGLENLKIITGKKEGRVKWTSYLLGTNETNNKLFSMLKYYLEKYWEKENVLIDYFLLDLLINYLYENDAEIKEMLDDVEENNPEMFSLLLLLSEPYNETIYKKIEDTHTFQKLSQKKSYRLYKNGRKTFAQVLLKESENE